MALTLFNIKKWTKMIFGKSLLHVNQNEGKVYSVSEIKGYYNDMTEKVTKDLKTDTIPKVNTESGEEIFFPTAVFQYGLGAYDLYLSEGKKEYYEKFTACANWALENQDEKGRWNNFFFIYPDTPYSAMSQGEGISILIRAYKEFEDEKYFQAAKKALEFMLTPIENGGTTKYDGDDIYLLEYTNKSVVLNGWIFAIFGIVDYLKVDSDNRDVISKYQKTIKSLINSLPRFDCGFWSLYDFDSHMTSPFYHNLHIAQLKALYALTEESIFKKYFEKWSEYQAKKMCSIKAFIKKSIEKIKE